MVPFPLVKHPMTRRVGNGGPKNQQGKGGESVVSYVSDSVFTLTAHEVCPLTYEPNC